MALLGIDIGGTNLQAAVVDGSGIMGRAHASTEARRGLEHVIDAVVQCAEQACRRAGIGIPEVDAVGIASAGIVDASCGRVLLAENLRWRDVPLGDLLSRKLGRPVVLNNDVNAAVWAERACGAVRGFDDVLGVWIGTGVGGGLIIGGRLVSGAFHTAGEIGHTLVPLGNGEQILEAVASRPALLHSIGGEHDDDEMRSRKDAWLAGDKTVGSVFEEAADHLGFAIANAVTLLSLRAVVLGGGVSETLGEPWLHRVRQAFEQRVFPDACRACELRLTELAGDAGLIGAALLAHLRISPRRATEGH